MPLVEVKGSEYIRQNREHDFVVYVSRTSESFIYLGLVARDSLSITVEDVRSTDEESGGELLYYKTSITFRLVQVNLTTVKGIDNYIELTKGKWNVYFECIQDKSISFSTPFRVALKTQQVSRYNEQYTDIEISFLTDKVDWLKGNRFSDPVFVNPVPNAVNVEINTQIVIDIEPEVTLDFELRLDSDNSLVSSFVNVYSTNGYVNGNPNPNVSASQSPANPLLNRLTFTVPALQHGTLYRIVIVGRRFGYQSTAISRFTTLLTAPLFETPPTPINNETFAFLEQITIQTRRTNLVSQEALITIKNTTNPSNPITVLSTTRPYNAATQLSLTQAFNPVQYGKYTIEVQDRAGTVKSGVITRDMFYIDQYEVLASRSNVIFAWNSLKTVQSDGVATSLQLDGQGLLSVKPNLNLPTNPNNRPLVVTDSSHKNYPVLFAQNENQRHLYANTTLFTGTQIAVFLFKKTNNSDIALFGANIPFNANWGIRSFAANYVGQSYWSPSTGERFDNVFNEEFYERNSTGNIVQNFGVHPINKWLIVAIQYNIPITVANFALFGAGQYPFARDAYLSIGFIISSTNWNDRQDFVNYLKLFI